MSKEIYEKYESEVRSYCRKWPVEFTTAKGSILKGTNGEEYLDFFDGAGALNYGHNPDYIKEKLIKYLESDGIMHALDMHVKTKSDFIEFFEERVLKPRGLNYKIMFAASWGIENGKISKITEDVYAVTDEPKPYLTHFKREIKRGNEKDWNRGVNYEDIVLEQRRNGENAKFIKNQYETDRYNNGNFDTLELLEDILNDDHSGIEKPAAIILETVQAEGGIHVFSKEFLKGIRDICDKYDILMICDEIQVGCCRTGTFFSFERAEIVPDIVTMSKSIGGYGLPVGLTLFKPELDIWSPGEHNGTFRGVQLSLVAAKAGLEIMLDEKVEEQVQRKEKIVRDFLEKEIKPLLGNNQEIRGIGLIFGIEFGDGKLARKVLDKCFEKHLIVELAGRGDSVVKIMPSLVIDDELLMKGLDIIKDSVKEVLGR